MKHSKERRRLHIMKALTKRILFLVALMLLSAMLLSPDISQAKAKKCGYLGGFSMEKSQNFELKYVGHKLYLRGYAWKTNGNMHPGYPSDRQKTRVKKTFTLKDTCQFSVGDETETRFKFKNKAMVNRWCGKENKWISAPSVYVIAKGKNVVFISLGA